MDDQGQGNACQLYIPRICSPIFLRLECHGDISSVVSFDIARPSLTRVSSNRADPSRPSSLPIQIVDGPHGYPIDIRLFRAQDYKDDINRDHALIRVLLKTYLDAASASARSSEEEQGMPLGFVMRVSANEALGAVLVMKRMTGAIIDLGRARQAL
ncbi:hypothetical protein FOFC_06277 [Fusarium oxysporum]|nr:hypothetical protein FOFC_06277 [Fusarium oxysporum]